MGFEGLTFEMIGNISEDEIKEPDTQEIETEGQEGDVAEEVEKDIDFTNFIDDDVIDEVPESVGGVGQDGEEDKDTLDEGGSSPNDFYTSIATTLKEDGILNHLDEDDLKDIHDADSLAAIFQKQIDSMLDDQHKRINEALGHGVEPSAIQQYENVLSYVNNIKDTDINVESNEGEQLRGNIIVQDYINKGFSPERANREAKKSFDAGTDIEDAKLALTDVREFFSKQYEQVRNEAKEAKQAEIKALEEQSKKIEKMFKETVEPVKGVKLSKIEREKLVKQYTTFVGKDAQGNPVNALQKYAQDNPVEYQYALQTLFYLTDGFQNLDKAINKQVKKKTKSAFQNLENTLRNPGNSVGTGSINFGNDKSPDSFSGLEIALD